MAEWVTVLVAKFQPNQLGLDLRTHKEKKGTDSHSCFLTLHAHHGTNVHTHMLNK